MGDGNESNNNNKSTSIEMENLSLKNNTMVPRDLLQRFMGGASNSSTSNFKKSINELNQELVGGAYDSIELNLGLSLGGRFGVDKTSTSSKKLVRSSSIAGPIPLVREEIEAPATAETPAFVGLARTASLPVETEEEWRKRKDMQSLRRMEAKRRRSEKQKVLKVDQKDGGEVEVHLVKGKEGGREQYTAAMNKVGSSSMPPFGLSSWAAAARQTILGGGIEALIRRGKRNLVTAGADGSRQGSIDDSQGGGSSSCGDLSPGSIRSDQNRSNQDTTVGSFGSKSVENAGKASAAEVENPPKRGDDRAKESGMGSLEDMPCVFTKGDGPNGRRIEGILYKYGKGEEVRIMCVCHGSFHSPAGFVKHAGGTDIAHPLKHIVVNPASSFS